MIVMIAMTSHSQNAYNAVGRRYLELGTHDFWPFCFDIKRK